MPTPGRRRRAWWLGAVAICVLGFALRVGDVFGYWINGDEGIYYSVAHDSWVRMSEGIAGNAHPPLYYVLLRLLTWLSGDYRVLRLPALVAGCLAIYLVFALTRRLAGDLAGLLAALLLALSPAAIMMSQVARPYMLHLALVLAALIGLLRHREFGRRRDAWLYSVAMTLAALVHYSSIQVFGAIAVLLGWTLWRRRGEWPNARAIVIAQVPVAVCILALYLTHIRPRLMGSALQADAVRGWLNTHFASGALETWQSVLGFGEYAAGAGWVVTPLCSWVTGLIVCSMQPRCRTLAILAASALVIGVAFSALALYPFGGSRHSVYLLALVIPMASVALARLFGGLRTTAVAAATLAILVAADRPLATAFGADPERPGPYVELAVPVSEIHELVPVLDALEHTDGIVITDMMTACSLAPLFREARAGSKWTAGGTAYFQWGRRVMYTPSVWALEAGPDHVAAPQHLGAVLAALQNEVPDLATRDVRVVSVQGAKLPNQLIELGRALREPRLLLDTERVYPGRHFCSFAIDVAAIRAAYAETLTRARGRGEGR